MGANYSGGVCCQNSYTISNSETDLDLFKKDISKSKQSNRKTLITIYEQEEGDEVLKNKRNKEFLDRHKKDNSSKLNSFSNSRIENQEKIIRLKEIVSSKHSPTLSLRVLNSSSNLLKGTIISMNCQGLVSKERNGLLRNTKDGVIYFGYYPENDETEIKDIDYNIPTQKKLTEQSEQANIGRHFQVEFKLDKLSYFIRDLGVGYGTFARLDNPLVLKDNHLINIGETFLVSNFFEKNEDVSNLSQGQAGTSILSSNKNIQLKLKVYGVNNNGETFYFPPMNRNINIGRYTLADVQINDKLLSKIHCVINYSERDGWTMTDGHDDKPSTNGTWLYLNENLEIYDKMIFKANQTILQCSFQPNTEDE